MTIKIIILLALFFAIFILPFKKTQAIKNLIAITFIIALFVLIVLMSLWGHHLYADPFWFRKYLF